MRAFFAGSALVAVIALSACNKEVEAPPPTPLTDEEKLAMVATLPAPYNTADLTHGKEVFAFCRSCHTVKYDGANMTGPNLYGVFGRKAGTHKDYKYSDAVVQAGFIWDAEHIDHWLSKPKDYLPGTKMSFLGIPEEKDRVDVIGYLMTETGFKP